MNIDNNPNRRGRVRLSDVAAKAGVSLGTVSHVLNHPGRVSDSIREKVQQTIDELGYVRNLNASSLRSGIGMMVAMVVLDISNPFFTLAAAGVERELAKRNLMMTLSSTHSDVERERALAKLLAAQGERGLILTPASLDLQAAREVQAAGIKVVLFDYPGRPDDLSSVALDDRLGAKMAITHLLELGHRTIGFLNGPAHSGQAKERAAGVKDAINGWSGQQPVLLIERTLPAWTAAAGREGTKTLFDETTAPITAMFCANDLIAFGAFDHLAERGVDVPSQVSVVGFDDVPISAELSTPLTTIRRPTEELGATAVNILLEENEVQHIRLDPVLVVRKSTTTPSLE